MRRRTKAEAWALANQGEPLARLFLAVLIDGEQVGQQHTDLRAELIQMQWYLRYLTDRLRRAEIRRAAK